MEKILSFEKNESDIFRNNFLQHDYPLQDKFQEFDNISSDDFPIEYSKPLNNTASAISDRFSHKSKMPSVRHNDYYPVPWSCFSTNSFIENEESFGFRGSDTHFEVPASAAVMKKKLGRAVILSNGSDTQSDELPSASLTCMKTGKTCSITSSNSDASRVSEPHPILGRWSKEKSFSDKMMEEVIVNEGADGGNVSLVVGQPWTRKNSNLYQKGIVEMVHPAACGKFSTEVPNPSFGDMNTESYFSNDSKPSSFKSNTKSQWQELTVPTDNGWNNGSSLQSIIPDFSSFNPPEKSQCKESDFSFIYDDGSFVVPENCHHSCSHSNKNETSFLTRNLLNDLNICSRSDFQELTLLMWDLLKARGGSHNESEQASLHCRLPKNGEGTTCAFCKRNGETPEFYSTHVVKDNRGKVICPILRKYVCPLCSSTGDMAHTIRHCPLYSGNPVNTAFDTFATKRSSCGRRSRINSY
ncbi:hypothetical protein CHS0354_011593 [Potamilus streckersoni]|uniref:Nanos-type domain-containing protein n=1 Tax=Potamilus streckersoni TaxID=2493646 RepID=A0AAE0RRQ1_9BIVA|nr:hypothetical protein CHS0354_011593 [Potamilus streckersoni]